MRSSRTAIARATAVTLIVWVRRLWTTPLVAIEVTTCVTSAKRERALANRIARGQCETPTRPAVRTVRFRMRPGQPGIHVPHAIERPAVHSPPAQVIEVSESPAQ